jgi:crotonobetainyl-CoA:carnitine CoA-transferase CaiB-like acyl-CoA transferase
MMALTGVRVLDLSQNLAGPFCTQTLADLGADVIKVEPPHGDPARDWGPPFHDGASTIFRSANRNKRGVVLDLKSEPGRTALWKLIDDADVLVQSFRAGVIDRLGFGEAVVRARSPRLIYVSVTAYGEHGPLRELPGYDPLMQAHGGLMAVTGEPGRPARIGTSVVDMGTGLWATIAVLAALRERERTGAGAHVSASLYETTLAWNAYHLMGWFAERHVPEPCGTAFPLIAPYGAFPCRDGRLMIAAANDRLFQRLCAALALPELAGDARFATNPARVAHRALVDDVVARATRALSVDEAVATLRAAGVPCAPILDIAAVAAEPQTLASGILATAPGEADACPHVLPPLRWDGRRATLRRDAPRLGDAATPATPIDWLEGES